MFLYISWFIYKRLHSNEPKAAPTCAGPTKRLRFIEEQKLALLLAVSPFLSALHHSFFGVSTHFQERLNRVSLATKPRRWTSLLSHLRKRHSFLSNVGCRLYIFARAHAVRGVDKHKRRHGVSAYANTRRWKEGDSPFRGGRMTIRAWNPSVVRAPIVSSICTSRDPVTRNNVELLVLLRENHRRGRSTAENL